MTDVQPESTVRTFSVPAISCGHCVEAITSEVSVVDGVTAIEVDLETKLVTVAGGDHDTIVAAIDEAGYDVSPI